MIPCGRSLRLPGPRYSTVGRPGRPSGSFGRRARNRPGGRIRHPHQRWHDHGDRTLHVAGTARGPAGRSTLRHLFVRSPAVRDGCGTSSLRGEAHCTLLIDPNAGIVTLTIDFVRTPHANAANRADLVMNRCSPSNDAIVRMPMRNPAPRRHCLRIRGAIIATGYSTAT